MIGERKTLTVRMKGAGAGDRVQLSYVDQERGSPYPAWRALGSPQYPTRNQLDTIRKAAEIAAPETKTLDSRGQLTLDLPAEGVVLIESV